MKVFKQFVKWISEWTIKPPLYFLYVMKSNNVSFGDKAKIVIAIIYTITPIDLIPEFIPIAGVVDDIASIGWALHTVYSNITPEIKEEVNRHIDKMLGLTSDQSSNELIKTV